MVEWKNFYSLAPSCPPRNIYKKNSLVIFQFNTQKVKKFCSLSSSRARDFPPFFQQFCESCQVYFFAMCSLLLSAGCHSHRVLSTRGIHDGRNEGKKWKIHRVLSAHGGGSKSVEMDREKKLIELMGLINDWKSFTYKFSLWWKAREKRCGAEKKKHEMRMRYEFCSNEVLEQHSKWIDSFLIISKWGLGVRDGWDDCELSWWWLKRLSWWYRSESELESIVCTPFNSSSLLWLAFDLFQSLPLSLLSWWTADEMKSENHSRRQSVTFHREMLVQWAALMAFRVQTSLESQSFPDPPLYYRKKQAKKPQQQQKLNFPIRKKNSIQAKCGVELSRMNCEFTKWKANQLECFSMLNMPRARLFHSTFQSIHSSNFFTFVHRWNQSSTIS